MEKAIKLAIEGGYKDKNLVDYCNERGNDAPLLIDPLFWQAIGKSEGWGDTTIKPNNKWKPADGKSIILKNNKPKAWLYFWHNFIDKIANGGTPDEFFEDLLNKK